MTDTVESIMARVDEYAERREHRGEDRTEQERAALRAAVEQIVRERDALRDLLKEASGPMSYERWSSDFRAKVELAVNEFHTEQEYSEARDDFYRGGR